MWTVDYYAILEVGEGATGEEVRRAYRELAKSHHPDRNPNDPNAGARFKQLAAAYAVLSSPEARANYDASRRLWAAAEPPARETDGIIATCPNHGCRKRLRVDPSRVNETIRCRACGTTFRFDLLSGVSRADHIPHEGPNPTLCEFRAGKTDVRVTRRWVQVGAERMDVDAVTGIRYGVFQEHVLFIPAGRAYAVWLNDGRKTVTVECSRAPGGGYLRREGIEARFGQFISALAQTVQASLVSRMVDALNDGRGFAVGRLLWDGFGLHRFGRPGWLRGALLRARWAIVGGPTGDERAFRAAHLMWDDLRSYKETGDRIVLIARDGRAWARLSKRDDWNAVLVPALLNALGQR